MAHAISPRRAGEHGFTEIGSRL